MSFVTRTAKELAAILASLALLVAACDDDSTGPVSVPDVSGPWSGQYSVTSCMRSGALVAVFCNDVFAVGQSLILEANLVQTGADLEGELAQGSLLGAVSGDVDEDGIVVLSGVVGGATEPATTTILSWQTGLVGDSLIGSWRFRTVDNTGSGFGTATVDASLRLFGPSVLKFFGCPVEGTLTIDGAISDRLTGGDCELVDASFFDVYSLTVSAGDSVSIALRSTSFDAFLLIADVDEELIDGDDDSGGGPNMTDAEVIRRFQTGGTFLVIANSFAGGETGPYTLTATGLSPAASVVQGGGPDARRSARSAALEVARSKLRGGDSADRLPLVRKLVIPRRWSAEQ